MKIIFPAVKLRPQTPPIDKREIEDAAIPEERRIQTSPSDPPPPPPNRAISQWARGLEWRHAGTLHILVGKICITFFPFSCEACSLYLVLWLCESDVHQVINQHRNNPVPIIRHGDPCSNWETITACKKNLNPQTRGSMWMLLFKYWSRWISNYGRIIVQ